MNSTGHLVFGVAILLMVPGAFPSIATQSTDLVRVNIVVTEASRERPVRGLEKENLQIWEDDVAQEIVSVTPGSVDGEYVLAYKSTNSARDGKWRRLRAKVVPPKGLDETTVTFTVRFQAGYYAPGLTPGN